jgi:hypothetical protein
MKALEVFINGHRLCLAGVGAGVLSVHVTCTGGGTRPEHMFLRVGGLDSTADEHLRWDAPSIGVGAEVLVRVVEAKAADPPVERVPVDRPTALEECHRCLRECGERLTDEERRQLLGELIAALQRTEAELGAAWAPTI